MGIDWQEKCGAPLVAKFGDTLLYVPRAAASLAPFDVVGVFDAAYREVILLDAGSSATDAKPVVGINDSQFPAGFTPDQDDRVVVPPTGLLAVHAGTYIVKEPRPDGHGHTLFELARAAAYAP